MSIREMRFAVILNPSKNGADRLRDTFTAAVKRAGGAEPGYFETTVDDPGRQMTFDAIEQGYNVIVAAGGDGTVREIAEVLVQREVAEGEEQIEMAILPMGTGNLLARNLDMNVDDLKDGINWALQGTARPVDAVRIDLERKNGTIDEHVFLVMGGVGIDAEVMDDTRDDLKKKVGPLAYVEAGFRKMKGSNKPVSFRVGDGEWEKRNVRSVVFANCGRLQGGFDLVPEAKIDDGKIDLVVMTPRSPLDWARIFVKTLVRVKRRIPVIEYFQDESFSLRTVEPILAQLDGDPVGEIIGITARTVPSSLHLRTLQERRWSANLGTVFKR